LQIWNTELEGVVVIMSVLSCPIFGVGYQHCSYAG